MPKKILIELPDITYLKLLKKKAEDGYETNTWAEYLKFLARNVQLNPTISQQIHRGTKELFPMWMRNFAENLPFIREGKTLRELVNEKPEGKAIVIGRGPSVFRNKHLPLLAQSKFKGSLICTDGSFIETLKAGVTPNKFSDMYVMSVDGADIVTKWYIDSVVDEYAPKIKSILCTQVSHKVTKRVLEAGFQGPYWFVPTSDIISKEPSLTKAEMLMTCTPKNPDGQISMDCGGNCGTASWVFAFNILKRTNIALIGFNFGYPSDMPLSETYYYDRTVEHIGVLPTNILYEEFWHPTFKTFSKIDPVFKCYRESFYDMLLAKPDWLRVANCTEGGVLYLPPYLECKKFEEWLKECGN